MIAGHHRARWQDHAAVKSFTHHVMQRFLNQGIPRSLVHLVLIVIKQMGYAVFLTHLFNHFNAGGKIIHFMKQQGNAFFRQHDLQCIKLSIDKFSLTRRHIMRRPLTRCSNIQRQHACRRIATGGRQRQIIVQT